MLELCSLSPALKASSATVSSLLKPAFAVAIIRVERMAGSKVMVRITMSFLDLVGL
uniref:Uncharacterized protein n=1 Tax=Arundo donax TaxID=35708 RepID=A0A0A8YDB9_ARUDO